MFHSTATVAAQQLAELSEPSQHEGFTDHMGHPVTWEANMFAILEVMTVFSVVVGAAPGHAAADGGAADLRPRHALPRDPQDVLRGLPPRGDDQMRNINL